MLQGGKRWAFQNRVFSTISNFEQFEYFFRSFMETSKGQIFFKRSSVKGVNHIKYSIFVFHIRPQELAYFQIIPTRKRVTSNLNKEINRSKRKRLNKEINRSKRKIRNFHAILKIPSQCQWLNKEINRSKRKMSNL